MIVKFSFAFYIFINSHKQLYLGQNFIFLKNVLKET